MNIRQNDMAKVNNTDPLVTLTDEALKHLEAIKGEIEASKANLDALEEIGIDTSRLRDKIAWAEKARDVILRTMKK